MTIPGPVKKVVIHIEMEDKNNNGELDVSGYVKSTTVFNNVEIPIPVTDVPVFDAAEHVAQLIKKNALPALLGMAQRLPKPPGF